MYELHENEQYFFTEKTLDELEAFLEPYESVCCLCAPSLGKRLSDKGKNVRILDIDRRFESVNGFKYFDISKPEWLHEKFDIIICDPPFFNVSLSQLFSAIRTLAQNDFSQRLMISYLDRRANSIIGTFSRFGLKASEITAEYKTVQKCAKNDIRFFNNTNLTQEES